MGAPQIVYFSVDEYAGDVHTAVSMDGSSYDVEDPSDGPRFEVEITVIGTGSRKDALEAVATKVLGEIAAYG